MTSLGIILAQITVQTSTMYLKIWQVCLHVLYDTLGCVQSGREKYLGIMITSTTRPRRRRTAPRLASPLSPGHICHFAA